MDGIAAIGVDEVIYSKGHRYMTLVYQIDSDHKRLLGVIRDRNTRSLASFFESLGAERCAGIKVVGSDMWKPYLNGIAAMLPAALNVLDEFKGCPWNSVIFLSSNGEVEFAKEKQDPDAKGTKRPQAPRIRDDPGNQ